MKRTLSLLCSAIFLAISAATSFAHTHVHGYVTCAENGKPIPNVIIQLTGNNCEGAINLSTSTDINGHYEFELEPCVGSFTACLNMTGMPVGSTAAPLQCQPFNTINTPEIITKSWQVTGVCAPPPLACIGDRVWMDNNSNGIQDSGEPGVSGVTVQLYTCNDIQVGTTTTDSQGIYHFCGLQPGDYYVKVLPPPGTTFTSSNQGGDDCADSDVDPATGQMDCTTLVGGETDNCWDAGLVPGVDPCITLTKTPDAPTALNGAQMGYTYVVKNCGNTIFSNLAIIDDNGTPDFAGDDFMVASGISLNPGDTASYHVVVTLPVPECSNTPGGGDAGILIAQVLANGDIKVTFLQSRNLNDNVYGSPAAADGWSSHTFGNLTGSDKAEFRFTDTTGKVVLDFYLDYVSATNVSASFPSGYASLGPNGGDGSMITGAKTNVLWWTSTLADSLNANGPFPSQYLVNSPTPEASFPNWNYVNGYTVIVSKNAFGAAGFGGVTIPYVHNSPAKTGNNQISPVPCGACIQNTARVVTVNGTTITGVLATDEAIVCTGETVPPTPVCLLTHGALKLDKNTIQLPIKNNGTQAIFLTEVDLTFPAVNGKLKKVTLNGDVWVGLSGSPVALTSGFTSDPNKRKIDKGQTKNLVLQFEKNVSKTPGDYSGGVVKFGTDSSCGITFLQ